VGELSELAAAAIAQFRREGESGKTLASYS
jgi:hypothetical protein